MTSQSTTPVPPPVTSASQEALGAVLNIVRPTEQARSLAKSIVSSNRPATVEEALLLARELIRCDAAAVRLLDREAKKRGDRPPSQIPED